MIIALQNAKHFPLGHFFAIQNVYVNSNTALNILKAILTQIFPQTEEKSNRGC